MIQEFKIQNFLSFKDEVTFSFEATKDPFAEEYQVVEVEKGVRLLRLAVVYGANASGKSNLLSAFAFLHSFLFKKNSDLDEPTMVTPFMLDVDTPDQASRFELVFYVGSVKYWYQLVLDSKQIYLEKLSVYHTIRPTMLFCRELENNQSVITFNPNVVMVSQVIKEKISAECLINMSFFAARDKVNVSIPEIDEAKEWLKNQIMQMIGPGTRMFTYAENKIASDDKLKAYLLSVANNADFNISDISTQMIKENIPQDLLKVILESDTISEQDKDRLRKEHSLSKPKTDFIHSVNNERGREQYSMTSESQSRGTRRIFGLEAVLYEVFSRNGFLTIDEIETSLHPDLVEFFIASFLKQKSRSQMIVTTHYDPLLETIGDLLRKDSVWFTEKKESGHTELYSLVEFSGLNRLSSIRKAYRNGNFGALPKVKE